MVWRCGRDGIVAVLWDGWHAIDDLFIKKHKNVSSGIAYLISAVSGGVLVYAALFSIPIVGLAIALIFAFGSAIYLASKEKDKIQKWLLSMWWRLIPSGEEDVPEIMPTEKMEMESFNQLMSQESVA